MFRKYTAMALALTLAAAAIPALGEDQSGNTTVQDNCATSMCANATCRQLCATYEDCVSTCGVISSKISVIFPTASPRSASAQTSAGMQTLSPGHDYTTQSLSAQEQKMLNLLNQDRKNAGLSALTLDEELSRIARIKSEDMRDKGYFAHESPTYGNVRAMLRTFGYAFSSASENIAHHANVDKAQAAFMSSSGHRANILSAAWTKVGIGICLDRNGYIYATQIFAR